MWQCPLRQTLVQIDPFPSSRKVQSLSEGWILASERVDVSYSPARIIVPTMNFLFVLPDDYYIEDSTSA